MIKVIIFDLDGVLVDTKLIHFEALNSALKKYNFEEISIDDHVKIFDGLPTIEKLKLIQKTKKLPKRSFSKIQKYKQKITSEILKRIPDLPELMDRADNALKLMADGNLNLAIGTNKNLELEQMKIKNFRNNIVISFFGVVIVFLLVF